LEVLLVRVDKIIAGQYDGEFIEVAIQYWPDECALPEDLRSSAIKWRFQLTKMGVDRPLSEENGEHARRPEVPEGFQSVEIPRWVPTEQGMREVIPTEVLPLYLLQPGGLTPI
jgi:hypothetical protein